jgi:hypothetical protein
MDYFLPLWSYQISAGLTLLTGVLLLWQYPGAKGTVGHITRWGLALVLSVFVVYMNTVTVLNLPRTPITNIWHVRLLVFHQNVGLIYFALMTLMPVLGVSLMLVSRLRSGNANLWRTIHRLAGYAAGVCWLASNIASEIGSRIPRS